MEKDKYLFRSQIDIGRIAVFFLNIGLFICYFYFPPFCLPVWLLIILGMFFNYLFLAIFQYCYYFYDDRMVRVFIFRSFFRKRIFMYEQLTKIRYDNAPGYGDYTKFIVFRKKNNTINNLIILYL
jgi:hypothetical protein